MAYLFMKEGCLFVCLFVKFSFLKTSMPFATLLILGGKPSMRRGGPEQVGFLMFQPTVEKLLNIE